MADSCDTSLFGPNEDWTTNACLNIGINQWWAYSEGYGRAVDVLVNHVFENRGDIDLLVYPIVYNARHSFELRLKHLHRDCCNYLDLKYSLPGHHDLAKLWQMVRPLLVKAFPDEDHGDFDIVEKMAFLLSVADRASFAFRYPSDKEGQPSIEPEVRHLNIRTFSDRFSKAVRLLDGIHVGLDQLIEYKEDMGSEYGE